MRHDLVLAGLLLAGIGPLEMLLPVAPTGGRETLWTPTRTGPGAPLHTTDFDLFWLAPERPSAGSLTNRNGTRGAGSWRNEVRPCGPAFATLWRLHAQYGPELTLRLAGRAGWPTTAPPPPSAHRI